MKKCMTRIVRRIVLWSGPLFFSTIVQFAVAQAAANLPYMNPSLSPGPVVDLTKLKWLNGEYLRALSPDAFFQTLCDVVFSDDILRRIAPLVQTRIETLAQFGDMTDFFFKDDVMPAQEGCLPKKRTLEETLAFASEQLTLLEATPFTLEALEPALKQLGVEKEWPVKDM